MTSAALIFPARSLLPHQSGARRRARALIAISALEVHYTVSGVTSSPQLTIQQLIQLFLNPSSRVKLSSFLHLGSLLWLPSEQTSASRIKIGGGGGFFLFGLGPDRGLGFYRRLLALGFARGLGQDVAITRRAEYAFVSNSEDCHGDAARPGLRCGGV